MVDSETRLYCLVGNPVAKSLSPVIHNAAFSKLDMNAVYLAFCVHDLAAAINGIRALPISGASVTIPYKTAVLKYLDDIDDVAREMGAVNTLFWREGRLIGSNTDGLGAVMALKEKTEIQGRKCLVVGAGGAARGVSMALKKEGCRVVITNRTEEKGRALAEELGLNWVPFGEFWKCGAEILVQATSVGMYPNINETLVPRHALSSFETVMDIVYKPIETRLLREAGEEGRVTIDGLGMLIYQAAAQLRLWTGADPPIDAMRKAALEYLQNAE